MMLEAVFSLLAQTGAVEVLDLGLAESVEKTVPEFLKSRFLSIRLWIYIVSLLVLIGGLILKKILKNWIRRASPTAATSLIQANLNDLSVTGEIFDFKLLKHAQRKA